MEEEDERDGDDNTELPPKYKLKVARRGNEPWEFTQCFHGWVTRKT